MDKELSSLQKMAATGAGSGNHGMRNNLEQLYGRAYQREVLSGTKPQIRKKYRP